jgi:hypothetical protein
MFSVKLAVFALWAKKSASKLKAEKKKKVKKFVLLLLVNWPAPKPA